ncbi:MAG: hypothetical protein A4E47_00294 [Methanosaeta sp. PtaU1.Bin028]|nr:MAG: hypothetical protein A4E47_00294 [Methanosaeta sp. PtaU1.Bin028]
MAGAGEEVAEEEEPDDSTLKDALERGGERCGIEAAGICRPALWPVPTAIFCILKMAYDV